MKVKNTWICVFISLKMELSWNSLLWCSLSPPVPARKPRTVTYLSLKNAPIAHQTSNNKIWQMSSRQMQHLITYQDKQDHIIPTRLSILKVVLQSIQWVTWKQGLSLRNVQNVPWISGLDDNNNSSGVFRFMPYKMLKDWKNTLMHIKEHARRQSTIWITGRAGKTKSQHGQDKLF